MSRVAYRPIPGVPADMTHLSHTPPTELPPAGLTATGQFRVVRSLEAAVTSREAILGAVAFAATRFLDARDWESSVRDVLERLGTAAEVSRVYLFELFSDSNGVLRTSQRYEWAAPGIRSELGNPELQNLDLVAAGLGRWGGLLRPRHAPLSPIAFLRRRTRRCVRRS